MKFMEPEAYTYVHLNHPVQAPRMNRALYESFNVILVIGTC